MSDVKVFNVPNSLKKRASKPGGKSFAELEAAGQNVVARQGANYPVVAAEDIADLRASIGRLKDGSGSLEVELQECFRIAHDIRGQAGSFEYPLLGFVAKSLSTFIYGFKDNPPANVALILPLIELHANTLHLFLSQKIKGEGGAGEAKVIQDLALAVKKINGVLGIPDQV